MGLLDWLAAPVWQIGVLENRLTILEPKTGRSAERQAEHEFSRDGLLVVDAQILEHELTKLFRAFTDSRWMSRYPVVEVHQFAWPIQGLELEAVRIAVMNAGASKVVLLYGRDSTP